MEVYDNGHKLGDGLQSSINTVYALPDGSHTLTLLAVTGGGDVLGQASANFTVIETCPTSGYCNLDQVPVNTANPVQCSPSDKNEWVAVTCTQDQIQGGGSPPVTASATPQITSGTLGDEGETSLNGSSLLFSENQASGGYSNVQYLVQAPNNYQSAAPMTVQNHWTLDAYVYLPNPTEHQAFEMDVDYVAPNSAGTYVWTKFYTQCAFNLTANPNKDGTGVGYWQVASNGAGWANVLDTSGKPVACTQDQFATPSNPALTGNPSNPPVITTTSGHSDDPAFTGWHHIVWSFLRNADGSASYQALTFDGQSTALNSSTKYATPLTESTNKPYYGVDFQLDGNKVASGGNTTVNAYVNEVNVTYTP